MIVLLDAHDRGWANVDNLPECEYWFTDLITSVTLSSWRGGRGLWALGGDKDDNSFLRRYCIPPLCLPGGSAEATLEG